MLVLTAKESRSPRASACAIPQTTMFRTLLVVASLASVIAYPASARGLPLRGGGEFQVNEKIFRGQRNAQVIYPTDASSFVIYWSGRLDSQPGNHGVLARKFETNLATPHPSRVAATFPSTLFQELALDSAHDGNVVGVWQNSGRDGSDKGVFGGGFDSAGEGLGVHFAVNSYTTGTQYRPDIGVAPSGNFMVVWMNLDDSSYDVDIRARVFSADGQPVESEFVVATAAEGQPYNPAVAGTGDGFLVAWQALEASGDLDEIVLRKIDSEGGFVGGKFVVNQFTPGSQSDPAVAYGGDGTGVAVWQSASQDGDGLGVFARRLARDGRPVGDEFQVNSFTTGNQFGATASVDDGGRAVFAWRSSPTAGRSGQDGDGLGLFGRAFSEAGLPITAEFQVNSYTTGDQGPARSEHIGLAQGPGGRFVVSWASEGQNYLPQYSNIFAQQFSLSPTDHTACGNPDRSAGVELVDAVQILRGAVGLVACSSCECDVNGSSRVEVSDALLVLAKAVGRTVEFRCPFCSE